MPENVQPEKLRKVSDNEKSSWSACKLKAELGWYEDAEDF